MIEIGKMLARAKAISTKLCLLAMLSGCPAAMAQLLQPRQPPKVLTFDDGHGILQAMRAGDGERLDVIRKGPLPPFLVNFANAAYFRSLFQLNTSSKYARKCYEYGMQSGVLETDPVIATMCGQLLAGNLNMEGDVANWAKMVVKTRRAVLPVFQKIVGRLDVVPSGFDDMPAEPFTGTVAANRVFQSDDVVVPRIGLDSSRNVTTLNMRDSSFAGAYLVMVKINGVNRTMVLDTGSSITMLRSSTARALGIEANPSPYLQLAGGQNLPTRPKTETVDKGDVFLGVAHQMSIGMGNNPIVLKDVPVGIGGDFDVLGMNVLSRMNSLYITAEGLVMNAKKSPFACKEPLEVASNLPGAYIPMLRYLVDGVAQPVAFDSGSMSYLKGTSSAPTTHRVGPDVTRKQVDIAGVYENSYVPVRAILGAGSTTYTVYIKVYPSYKAGYRYALGVKALKDFKVLLDFKRGKACLARFSG